MLKTRTGDQALVREINLSIILHALRDHSPTSRASLASATGLNKTTVSSLVLQLIDAGFVSEIGMERSEDTGRPAILMELNPSAGRMIGAEIGVDFLSIIITDFAAAILWRHDEKTSPGAAQEAILRRLLSGIREGIARTGPTGNAILGLGLGVPGLVDVTSGTLLFAPNLGWRDVPLRGLLESQFAFPVYIDNEANMATLGESYFGVARGAKSILYLSAGVGLGGGIVLDGRVLPGADGCGGEVGHMTLILDGPRCNCGNYGCWETLVSQEALFRRVGAAITAGAASALRERAATGALTILRVVEAARAGDQVALDALHETGVYLGIGLANLVNALNPEIIVFGGSLSLAGEFLLPTIRRVIGERALPWSVESMRILIATHGSDACMMGGIAAVYYQILNPPFKISRS